MKKIALSVALMLFIVAGIAHQAQAVSVTYTVSGTSGNYMLDFTLTNDIPASYNQTLYFFGLDLPEDPSRVSPTGWGNWGSSGATWSNAAYGGSSIIYTSNYITSTGGAYTVASGSSLSGFTVHTAVIPSTINFFTFGTGSDYFGSDAFYQGWNPGFEGVATLAQVPEPSTMLLLGTGLTGIAFLGRKLRRGKA